MPLTVPVRGTAKGERRTGFFFDWYEQWSGLFGRCNWYDFTLIHVEGEFAPYTQRWEFAIALLGLGARVSYVYSDAFAKETAEIMSDIERKSSDQTRAEHE